jgi:hypothetical protein
VSVPGDESEAAALVIGSSMSSAWREDMLTRANELTRLASWIDAHGTHDEGESKLPRAAEKHLDVVRRTAASKDEHKNNEGGIKRLWRAIVRLWPPFYWRILRACARQPRCRGRIRLSRPARGQLTASTGLHPAAHLPRPSCGEESSSSP